MRLCLFSLAHAFNVPSAKGVAHALQSNALGQPTNAHDTRRTRKLRLQDDIVKGWWWSALLALAASRVAKHTMLLFHPEPLKIPLILDFQPRSLSLKFCPACEKAKGAFEILRLMVHCVLCLCPDYLLFFCRMKSNNNNNNNNNKGWGFYVCCSSESSSQKAAGNKASWRT